MSEETKHHVTGYRNAALILRDVAELAERQPDLPKARVTFGSYESDNITYFVHGAEDYTIYDREERERANRENIERDFEAIMSHFDSLEGISEWTANDPANDDYNSRQYFILTALYRGAEVIVKASRSDVGEEVKVVQAGPQYTELEDGTIRALKQEAVVWKPTIRLSALARPGFELDAAPRIKELTA